MLYLTGLEIKIIMTTKKFYFADDTGYCNKASEKWQHGHE